MCGGGGHGDASACKAVHQVQLKVSIDREVSVTRWNSGCDAEFVWQGTAEDPRWGHQLRIRPDIAKNIDSCVASVRWVPGHFVWTKAGGSWNHSFQSSAEVKNGWRYTSTPLSPFVVWTGTTLLFIFYTGWSKGLCAPDDGHHRIHSECGPCYTEHGLREHSSACQ